MDWVVRKLTNLVPHVSRLTIHIHSQLTSHDSLTTHNSHSLTSHDSRLTSHVSRLTLHSQLTTHNSQLTIHSSPIVTERLTTRDSYKNHPYQLAGIKAELFTLAADILT